MARLNPSGNQSEYVSVVLEGSGLAFGVITITRAATLGFPTASIRLNNSRPAKGVSDREGVVTLEVEQGVVLGTVRPGLIAHTSDPNCLHLESSLGQDNPPEVMRRTNSIDHAAEHVSQIVDGISISCQGDIHKKTRIQLPPHLHNSN